MNPSRSNLIRELAADLQPVRPPPSPVVAATAWWLMAWALVVIITLVVAPARPGAVDQLVSTPRFLAESLVGLAAGWLASLAAFRSSVPGAESPRLVGATLILALVWVSTYVIGLDAPALPASMLGKRGECFLETLLYALPVAMLGRWMCHRYLVLAPARTTALIALSAAMMPGLFMQIACMYGAEHILTHHILPIPAVVAALVAGDWAIGYFNVRGATR